MNTKIRIRRINAVFRGKKVCTNDLFGIYLYQATTCRVLKRTLPSSFSLIESIKERIVNKNHRGPLPAGKPLKLQTKADSEHV